MVLPKTSAVRWLFKGRSTIYRSVSAPPFFLPSHDRHSLLSPQACFMSVLTTNVSPVVVGPLRFHHDPGRYICRMNTKGLHFDSGKTVLDCFLQTLASVVGSIEEAKKRIYFVTCVTNDFWFGAKIDELTCKKLEALPGISLIPDDQFDVRNKSGLVQSNIQFSPLNWDHRLVDMSRYHESSKRSIEGVQDPGHWLIKIREPADGFSTSNEVIYSCIDFLAAVVGRKEAIKKIYAVWCTKPYGFGAEIDLVTLKKLEALLPNLELLPDHTFDVKKDCETLVVHHVAGPDSSSPVGIRYWTLYDTYGSCEDEDVIDSDEDDLDADDGSFDYDEKDLESDDDNLKSDGHDQKNIKLDFYKCVWDHIKKHYLSNVNYLLINN